MQPPAASPLPSTVLGTGQSLPGGQREKLAADELAVVLSHFDIGIIESITEFPRGSRKAPKLLIAADHGKFLLKRRAKGKDDLQRVAFCHALQAHLADRQFPLPHLIPTRNNASSMLHWHGAIYELFEFIAAQPYPFTLEATFDAGRTLALFHKLLGDFQFPWQPPSASYHNQPSVEQALLSIPALFPAADPPLAPLLAYLAEAYPYAAQRAEETGIANWPKQHVHADWHPGNMLFKDDRVVAVIDYDSARLLPRIIDAANGALQFSMTGGDDDPAQWPDSIDQARFKRFLRGYDDVLLLSQAELRVIPWLMTQALIAEAVLPIAMTGAFGRLDGLAFLQTVRRKVAWLLQSAPNLVELLEA
jgi:homoserine kinase type II